MNTAVKRLINAGFKPLKEELGDAFGDYLLEFCRSNVVIRLVRDRCEYFVGLRLTHDVEWFDSDIVLRTVSNVIVAPTLGSWEESLDTVVPLLLDRIQQLDEAFAKGRLQETQEALHIQELAARKRTFGF